MGCVKHFASSVTAVELDRVHCKVLEQRGFQVICRDFLSLQPHEMPLADVLYWWPQMSWEQNEQWMIHAMRGYVHLIRHPLTHFGLRHHCLLNLLLVPRRKIPWDTLCAG